MDDIIVLVAVVATVTAIPLMAEESRAGRPGPAAIGRLGPGEVAAMIQSYQLWDAMVNDGKGRSDRKTSGGLGWGESSFLRNYMLCYHVTRDPYWCDKVVDHFDRMVGNLEDPKRDGYLAWRTPAYSVGIVRAAADGDVGDAEITPALQRLYVKRGGEKVTGHDYCIEFLTPDEFVVRDVAERTLLDKQAYKPGQKIEDVPGATLIIKGRAREGAKFAVETVAPEEIEYQVHDGMVTYPIAQFIEVVHTTPALHERYMKKAQEYAGVLSKHFLEKWEATWVDLPEGAGLYKFTTNVTQRFPDTSLPHNQFLALGRTWLVLQAVPGLEHRELYRDRATKMAKYFKKHLRRHGNAYVWNYWDPLPHEQVGRHIEDTSHATIDIGFAVEARDRGIVFTDEDLRRFASTYVDIMWNRDKASPGFGKRVNTRKGAKAFFWEWIHLAVADARVWELAWAMFEPRGKPTGMGPSIAYVYDRLVGVDELERNECRKRTAAAMALMEKAGSGPMNTGFEVGTVGTRIVPGWTLTTWGPDQGGEAKCVAGGHKGDQSIALVGKGPKVNVLAQCMRRVSVEGKMTCVIKAYYKTVGAPGPRMSILGYDPEGKRLQYTHSPGFPLSTDWREARWPAKVQEGVVSVDILLRNGGAGAVYWDEMEVETE